MASVPVIVLVLVVSTLVFETILFGDELPEASFPTFEQPESGGFWGALDVIVAVLKSVWSGLVFFFNLVTFNVPGSPWYVRVMMGSAIGGALIWSIIGLIRGGGND